MSIQEKKDEVIKMITLVEMYNRVLQIKGDGVKLKLAEDTRMPVEILEELARDDSEHVRKEVAQNPSTPINILEEFAQDEEMYIYLIRNSTIQELARGNSEKKESPEERDDEDTSITKIVDEIKGLIVQDEMLDAEIQKMNDLKQGDLSK